MRHGQRRHVEDLVQVAGDEAAICAQTAIAITGGRTPPLECISCGKFGRGGGIRTHDHQSPSLVHSVRGRPLAFGFVRRGGSKPGRSSAVVRPYCFQRCYHERRASRSASVSRNNVANARNRGRGEATEMVTWAHRLSPSTAPAVPYLPN